MRFDPDYGCQHHGTETCTDPDCIRAAGGSVYADELRQAEDLLDAMDVETWLDKVALVGGIIYGATYKDGDN